MNFRWGDAIWFSAAVVPILVQVFARRRRRDAVVFSSVFLLDAAGGSGVRPLLTRLPLLLGFGSLGCLAAALARPQTPETSTRVERPRATLLIVVDVSGSMGTIEAAGPTTRLDQAKRLLRESLRANTEAADRPAVGLIAFSATPTVLSPPTTDYSALETLAAELQIDSRDNRTDIGAALATAVDLAVDGKLPRRRILLMTDGAQRVPDSVGPIGAARIAAALKVPIDVIGIGTAHGNAVGFEADEAVAKRIAEFAGGEFLRIERASAAGLLKTRVDANDEAETVSYRIWNDRFRVFIAMGIALWVAAEILSRTWLRVHPS